MPEEDPWDGVGDLSAWRDSWAIDVNQLDLIRQVAIEQCRAYAPQGSPVTPSVELAVQMQARAIYSSLSAGPGDSIGPDGFTVTVYPMDRTVKRLLRPHRGRPRVR